MKNSGWVTPFHYRQHQQKRREQMRANHVCINGSVDGSPSRHTGRVHGPPNPKSGKCDDCERVAKESR